MLYDVDFDPKSPGDAEDRGLTLRLPQTTDQQRPSIRVTKDSYSVPYLKVSFLLHVP